MHKSRESIDEQHLDVSGNMEIRDMLVYSWRITNKYPCPKCGIKLKMPNYECLKCNLKLKIKVSLYI